MGDRIPADKVHLKDPTITPLPGQPAGGSSSTTWITIGLVALAAYFILK